MSAERIKVDSSGFNDELRNDLMSRLEKYLILATDYIVPTEEQVIALYEEAKQRGCGLSVTHGRPGTVAICPWAVVGELLIVNPEGTN